MDHATSEPDAALALPSDTSASTTTAEPIAGNVFLGTDSTRQPTTPASTGTVDPNGWITDEVRELAKQWNIPEHVLPQYGSRENLENAIDQLQAQIWQLGQQVRTQAQQQQQTPYPNYYQQYPPGQYPDDTQHLATQQPTAQQPTQHKQNIPEYAPDYYYEVKLDAGEYGEELPKVFKQMNEHYARHLTDLAASIQQLYQWMGQMRAMSDHMLVQMASTKAKDIWDGIQQALHNLGPDIEQAFGSYEEASKDPQGPQAQNWQKLYQALVTLDHGYRASRMPRPDWSQLVSVAIRMAFPELDQRAQRNTILGAARNRAVGFTNRPNRSPSHQASAIERAIQRIDEWRAQHGIE